MPKRFLGSKKKVGLMPLSLQSKIQTLGFLASVALPFFNIPLMIRIVQRKSSEDLSLVWLFGVYLCLILMTPTGWISTDFTFKIFCLANVVFFSGVVILVLFYRFKKKC